MWKHILEKGRLLPVSTPDKQHTDREITYRVGWKKGRIQVPDHTSAAGHTAAPASKDQALSGLNQVENRIMRLIWKGVPFPSLRVAAGLAIVLPAVTFGAVVWLVAKLTEG
jgi:hypothetical protein